MVLAAAEDSQQILLLEVRRFEELDALEHVDLTGRAARASARERHGQEVAVAEVEEISTLRLVDGFGSPGAGGNEFDPWHSAIV
jgi:hypothetical protein